MALTRTAAWVTALGLVVSLAACAGDSDDTPRADPTTGPSTPAAGFVNQTKAGTPKAGGTLTFADYSEARSLDPAVTIATGSSGGSAIAAVYDVLVRGDDATGDYEPWLAESLEPDAEQDEWTLGLRDGVTFSDGTPLDAAAVKASIERYIERGGSDAAVLSANITEIAVPDAKTVVFTLAKPWSTFWRMLSLGAGMVVAPTADQGKEFTPIGAGPFTFGSYSPAEELVLKARKDYWGGAPHLDALRFVWINGGQANLEALQAGDAQMTFLREPEVVAKARATGMPGYLALLGLGNTLWINNREGRPGADLRVRRAISLAVDADLLAERATNGTGMPTKNIFGPESRWYSGAEDEVDLEEAKRLVAEAKADGYDGVLELLGSGTPAGRKEAVALQGMLQAAGFTVEIQTVSTIADRIQRMYMNHDFDITTGAGSISESDPFHQLNDNLSSDSFLNITGSTSPEMDAALAALQSAANDTTRQDAIDEVQELWDDAVPAVNLATMAHLLVWDKEVHGVVADSEYMMLFNDAWID